MADSPQGITLRNFLSRLKTVIMSEQSLLQQWVIAEISDFRYNRHCYMQLLEKDANGTTIATARATIWQSTFYAINSKFQSATGQNLANGLKVMLQVSANMSEQYGLSLNVTDIAPEYTLGDMQRLRLEIIERLTREGLIDLNKELSLPLKPQRIAVISAAGAAGYGDFCNQLSNNASGIKFYTCLFAASMQGKDTAPTVIDALRRIDNNRQLFDVVVIIRGGGATTDLNSFDNYELAKQVALCQLPVITGIGHERDKTVLDYVASSPVKTPTAAAELIINQCSMCLNTLNDYQTAIVNAATATLREEKIHIDYFASQLQPLAKNIISREQLKLSNRDSRNTIRQNCRRKHQTWQSQANAVYGHSADAHQREATLVQPQRQNRTAVAAKHTQPWLFNYHCQWARHHRRLAAPPRRHNHHTPQIGRSIFNCKLNQPTK